MSPTNIFLPRRKSRDFDLIAKELALDLRAGVRTRRRHQRTRYISQYSSPLGRRKHVELGRSGIVPAKTVGDRVLIPEVVVRWYLSGYYSQRDSPLGRYRHLELAERGTLPCIRERRGVLIRRDLVHQYLSARGARR
jgi:hypothetical protein